jgi:hypothetical protein
LPAAPNVFSNPSVAATGAFHFQSGILLWSIDLNVEIVHGAHTPSLGVAVQFEFSDGSAESAMQQSPG